MSFFTHKTATLIIGVSMLLMSSCSVAVRSGDNSPRGTVRFTCDQIDATLEVDETRVGPVAMFKESGVLLKPGNHRIVVHKENFFKYYKLINVKADKILIVDISLKAIPY